MTTLLMNFIKKWQEIVIFLLCFLGLNSYLFAAISVCHPLLWPDTSALLKMALLIPKNAQNELATQQRTLERWSEKQLREPTHAVKRLRSSGIADLSDPKLIASREAFKDADRAALLALTYRLTHNINDFNQTRRILINWSTVNSPTGHPIDETRLEGMIWAYDLIACELSSQDKTQILRWFEQLRQKKSSWQFGKRSSTNNYRIHQLKMLIMLDKVLEKMSSLKKNIATAEKYSNINLDPKTGISVDYLERDALYYHNYVLQPWLEISLITGCCQRPIKKAFNFLSKKILSEQINGEFKHSQVNLDALRAMRGFKYATKGGRFDTKKAAPTILMYYTLVRTKPDPSLWLIQEKTKSSPWIRFLRARRILWQP